MPLLNAERAEVDIRKLRDYCLNLEHPRGRHKARVFVSALGLTINDAKTLQTALLNAVRIFEAMPSELDMYGQRYVLDFLFQGSADSAMLRSSWIIRSGEDFPRLVSCYVL